MRRRLAIACLGVAGLGFYVWTAVTAPVVLWSDSRVDLRWARQGVGIWHALSSADARELHPLKPGYLIFLRLAGRGVGNGSPLRTIVVLQSLLLWTSIAGASARIARGKGTRAGVLAYAVLILFLPIRDSASAIMSEALAGALLLTLAAFALFPPRRFRGELAIALALIGLYEFRPNVGAVGFILLVAGWSFQRRFRSAARTAATFGAGMVVVMVFQSQAGIKDFHRSVPILLHFGSAEYYWSPSLRQWPDGDGPAWSNPRTRRALENWKSLLAEAASDRNRELLWRGFHGVFGAEYYDARWSTAYDRLDRGVRYTAPLFILFSLAFGMTASRDAWQKSAAACTSLLLLGVVSQDLLFGSSPRLVLPFLPAVLLLGVANLHDRSSRNRIAAAVFVSLGLLMFALRPSIMTWDFGVVESRGVTIEQTIPVGALPATSPAVMHIRIAPTVPGTANFEVMAGATGLLLLNPANPQVRPIVSVSLPQSILDENRLRPIPLRVVSTGTFDASSYLIFPVVPPPWRPRARRLDSSSLSPVSDVQTGSLDWWAHRGRDEPREEALGTLRQR